MFNILVITEIKFALNTQHLRLLSPCLNLLKKPGKIKNACGLVQLLELNFLNQKLK